MKLSSVMVALSLLAAVGLVGCGDQSKKPPSPAPTIGVAPGETAPYENSTAPNGPPTTPPIIATPTYGSKPVQTDVTPPPTTPKKPKTATTKDTPTTGTPKASVKTYKVQKGDTFSSISKKVYGHSKYAKKIYEANKDKPGVKSFDVVDEGVELKIPELKAPEAKTP
jgi:nucleoid-associated protein YgaU